MVVGEAMEMMLCSQLSVESYYLHSFASKNFDGKATWKSHLHMEKRIQKSWEIMDLDEAFLKC